MKKIFSELIASIRSYDLKANTTSFVMQVGAVLLNLLTNLLLTHIMLPSDYGAFAYTSTLIFVLSGLGTFGTTNLIVREAGASNQNYSLNKTLLNWSFRRSIIFTLLALAVFIFISLQFNLFFGNANMSAYQVPILVSLLSVPLLTFIYINQAYLQGLRNIFSALFAEKIIKPVLLIAVSVLFFLFIQKKYLNFTLLAWINLFSFMTALLVIHFAVRKSKINSAAALPKKLQISAWKKSSLTFFFLSAVTLIYLRTDMLCLGFLESPEHIGIYNISSRVAETVSFPLHILTFGLAPLISGLFHADNQSKLQKTITVAARTIFILCLVPALLFILFGNQILSLFGQRFEDGYSCLLMLIAGNMLNVIAGPAGYVLAMTGHERLAFISMTVSCIVNIGLNLILIPIYGISGAAIAVCCAMFVWNILITIFTIKKTGIRPDIFFMLKRNEV